MKRGLYYDPTEDELWELVGMTHGEVLVYLNIELRAYRFDREPNLIFIGEI